MQFLYAIEGVASVNASKLTELGLDKIIHDPSRAMQAPSATPGEQGCIFSSGRDDKRLRYAPDEQTWVKSLSENGGGHWIGFYTDNPPTAADLARDEQIGGHDIAAAGGLWKIPCARVFPEGTRMPRSMKLGSDGNVYGEVMAKYKAFCERADVLWDDLYRLLAWLEGEQVMDAAGKFSMVVEAIAFNYYVGGDECNALEILTTENIERFLWAIVDGPALMENVEKNKKKILTELSESTGSGSESRSSATVVTTDKEK